MPAETNATPIPDPVGLNLMEHVKAERKAPPDPIEMRIKQIMLSHHSDASKMEITK